MKSKTNDQFNNRKRLTNVILLF